MTPGNKKFNILIATGIYPPDIGGPAQYAKNFETVWRNQGHRVAVRFFRFERRMPAGLRHLWYFLKILPAMARSDMAVILDTFSAAAPATAAARIFGKPTIIRIGGDFLWEQYVERTGDLVLLRRFYETRLGNLSFKERLIFRLTKWALRKAGAVVFSTGWQREIWRVPYGLPAGKIFAVENYYGPKEKSFSPAEKNFLAGTRPLKWKNSLRLKEAFRQCSADAAIKLDDDTAPFERFMEKLSCCYAVILPSLGDISPNFILDAIRYDKPFILTRETGLCDRVKDCAIFVDPESVSDIADKIRWLSDPTHYDEQKRKVQTFGFQHSWEEIAGEFLAIFQKIR